MKTLQFACLLVCLCLCSNLNAQLLKKIKERASEAVEETIARKSAEKAAEETEKTIDKIFESQTNDEGVDNDANTNTNEGEDVNNAPSASAFSFSKVDPKFKSNSYSYEWKYSLAIDSRKNVMKMHYYLRPGGTDYAAQYEMEKSSDMMNDMITIMDEKNSLCANLMKMNGTKSGTLIGMDFDKMIEGDDSASDYTIKEIGKKTIHGYECQGFEMENEEHTIVSYVAFDTPVSLAQAFGGMQQKNMPKGLGTKWLERIGDNSLMMEMTFTSKKKEKENFKMYCTDFRKESLDINLSEYQIY